MNGSQPLSLGLNVRLSFMMFLQYAIWGAWLPLFFSFLTEHRGFMGDDAGMLFSIGAIGALFAPFIAGQIADRWFSTERFLAISHLLGAALVWQLAEVEKYSSFVVFGLLYSLIYSPTLPLTNSLAFHHLPDRDRDFGKVRVWGTVGWIVVGIGIGQWLLYRHTPTEKAEARAAAVFDAMPILERHPLIWKANHELYPEKPDVHMILTHATPEVRAHIVKTMSAKEVRGAQVAGMADSFRLSAILGALLGLYCLSLPKTPPRAGTRKFAPFEALGEVRRMPLIALFLVSFPIACVHQFYFVHTAQFLGTLKHPMADSINQVFGVGGGGLMTIGQMAEILVLAFMPVLARAMSRKTLLTIGLLAYIARFAVFAYAPEPAWVIPALALHGFVFGCFFFVCFMIVDENTTPDVRASAQGLFNLVVVGLGVIVGNYFAGQVHGRATSGGATDWRLLYSVPMFVCVACFVIHMLVYPRAAKARAA